MNHVLRWMAAVMLATGSASASSPTDDAADTTRVAILMFDGVQIIDFAAPYEVFGQAGFEVFTVSADGEPVTAVMELDVNVDYAFDTAPPADILVVPGGNMMPPSEDVVTLAWIRERYAGSDHVLSVCTGSHILAAAGLLDDKQATTFHRHFDHMAGQFPDTEILRDRRWVDADNIVTSAGLASGIDAALHVVAKIRGERAARAVALHLEYDWSPEQGFVRGLMADRHIRRPESGVRFPEGTIIDRDLEVGDRDYWEIDYDITTPWSPEILIAHLARAAGDDPTLTLIENDDPLETGWEYTSQHGGRWVLRVRAMPAGEDGTYRATEVVTRIR